MEESTNRDFRCYLELTSRNVSHISWS